MTGPRRVLLVLVVAALVIGGGVLAWVRSPTGVALTPAATGTVDEPPATTSGSSGGLLAGGPSTGGSPTAPDTAAGGTAAGGTAASSTGRSGVRTSPLDACPARATPAPSQSAARRLPELSLPCLSVGTGADVDLAAAPGVPMVLNVWGSWCPPCRDELPVFQQLYERVPEQVQTLGLVVQDTASAATAYAADAALTFPSVLDATGDFLTAEGINTVPITYFVRADGTVAGTHVGPVGSYGDLIGLVSQYLGVTVTE